MQGRRNMDKLSENEVKKVYLQSYMPAVKAAKRIEEEIEELRMDKIMPSLVMDDMPHAHNQTDLSDYVARLDSLVMELVKARYERIELYAEIFSNIEKLENEAEKSVLTYRYLRRYSWEKICVEMNYQWAQTHRIHANALKAFSPTGKHYEKIKKEYEIKHDTQ